MCNDYFGIVPKFVVPGVKTGINIQYDNPRALGSDRICNVVAVPHSMVRRASYRFGTGHNLRRGG